MRTLWQQAAQHRHIGPWRPFVTSSSPRVSSRQAYSAPSSASIGHRVMTAAAAAQISGAAAMSTAHQPGRWRPASMPALDGFLERIKENNMGLEELPTFTPFIVGGKTVGQLKPWFVQQLARFPNTFIIQGQGPQGSVQLNTSLNTREARTQAVTDVLQQLRDEGHIKGWRNELYPVTASFYSQPEMLVERAAAAHFGIKAYGVHINGYVVNEDGSISLWVARRSKTKPTWPGKLDHIVAGGQPFELSPGENVIKECQEEAGISAELAAAATPVGAVSYRTVSAIGLKPDVLFVYDIQLPRDFVPAPQDGEVEEFMLWPIEKVAHTVANTTEFKTNCNLVIIDFLVRHGLITPEQQGYLQVVQGLRMGDCT